MPVARLGQVALTVADIKRSVEFYRDRLGVPFLFEAPPNLAFFDCGGVRLMLSPPESGGKSCSSVLYFMVDDIRQEYDALLAKGVSFEGEPHRIARLADREIWMAFFHDPDRHLLAIMSEPRIS